MAAQTDSHPGDTQVLGIQALLDVAMEEFVQRIRPLIAVIRAGRRGAGAGVLAGGGLVLTNAHVAGKGRDLRVILDDDQEFEAILIAQDPQIDLALLKVPVQPQASQAWPAAVFSTAEPRPGELVFAYGHPWGQRSVLTGGILSAIVSARTPAGQIPLLRTDLQLAPGNSGGPLLNAAGEVIGLNAMIFGGDQSVAIPSSLICSFLAQARQKQEEFL